MHAETPRDNRIAVYSLAIIGAFLLTAFMVWAMRKYANPTVVDNRPAERAKAYKDLRAAEIAGLNTPGVIDAGKGLIRLPITNAMEMVVREWKNPDAARSNLLDRVAKATAAPPKAPEKPSEFE
jgi:hypothetical protein